MAAHLAMKGADETPFGNALRLREESGDVWGWAWWDHLKQDVAFGLRMLRKSPAFTLTAIIVLGFGVGVNLGAFQVFNALAWRPLSGKGSGFARPVLAACAALLRLVVLVSCVSLLRRAQRGFGRVDGHRADFRVARR
jgi:hypothetical protein